MCGQWVLGASAHPEMGLIPSVQRAGRAELMPSSYQLGCCRDLEPENPPTSDDQNGMLERPGLEADDDLRPGLK